MEKKKLYIGNINYATSEDDLRDLFTPYGEVTSVNIVLDRNTGRSRGFGFVEMASSEEADAAVDSLNNQDFGGRKLIVNVARERRRF